MLYNNHIVCTKISSTLIEVVSILSSCTCPVPVIGELIYIRLLNMSVSLLSRQLLYLVLLSIPLCFSYHQIDAEIKTLKTVLASKQKRAADIRKTLGSTIVTDMKDKVKTIQESDV